MRLPAPAVIGYTATLVIAVAAAAMHPWFDVEAHFVRALSGFNAAVATMTSMPAP